MRIAYSNLIDATAVSITESTENANYPASNIQDQRLGLTWRTTTRSAGSVIIDLGASTEIDTVAIIGHNLSSAAVVTLTGSDMVTGSGSAMTGWVDKATLGSSLSISGVGAPALAALTASTVAFIDSDIEQLRTYSWSGSAWTQTGSSLSISGAGYPALAALTASTVAYIDSDIEQLRTYSWSGSAWTQTGSSLSISGAGFPALAALTASTVAYIDSNIEQLRTYSFNTTIGPQEAITYDSGMLLKFFTPTTRRYWLVDIVEQASTGSYIEVGRVWLGTYMTVDPSSLVDMRVTKRRSDTVVYGKHRQKFATPGYGWRRFELSFPATEASMLTQIETMYDTVGNHTSFIFANFDEARDWQLVEPCYVSVDGELRFINEGSYKATWAIALEEDL